MAISSAWMVLSIVLITAAGSYSLDCKDIDRKKCLCYKFDSSDIQCPIEDSQITISVSKKNYITLQCLEQSAPYIDLNIIPEMNIADSKLFKMQYCYLNTSFTNILKRFNVTSLNALYFETLALEENDRNISLSKESFTTLQDLESLTLSYSTLYLTEDFLANTPNLVSLVLSKNYMVSLQNYFKYVPKLKMLELTNDRIDGLPDGIFEDLSNLTRLFLFGNNISSFSRNTFRGLRNLQLLEISNNHIRELPEDTFADLPKLVNISLRGNQIKNTYSNMFANNPLLENIRLGGNKDIILSDYLFANLKSLRSVELFLNQLERLPENLFQNCESLQEITLKNNRLVTLPATIFKDLKNLRTLDLADNRLNVLPDEAFSSLENLEILNLSNNQLNVINEYLFGHLNNLKRLDLHKNIISVIDVQAFVKMHRSLTYLDLSYNNWNNSYGVPNGDIYITPLNSIESTETLILSHNKIKEIPGLISMLQLKSLALSFNEIDYLPVYVFAHSVRLDINIDLSENKIENIDFRLAGIVSKQNIAQYDGGQYNGGRTIFKLTNNPIKCDCTNYDLFRYNNLEMRDLKTLVDINQDGLLCANSNTTMVTDLGLSDIDCPLISGCPASCSCLYKPFNTAIVVDCSFQNLTSYPIVNFTAEDHSFNQTFLILSGNKLTKGPSSYEASYTNVTILDLSANNITEMNWIPPKVKELNLSYNQIKNLDSHFIHKLKNVTSLEKLVLKGNPWECTCKSLDMQKYLMQYFYKVNPSDVFCENAHAQLVKLTDLCKVSPYLSMMLPIVLAVFLCFAVAVALYYRYQNEIKIYLFAKNMCLWFVTEEELDKDKTYDVFISYAHQDERFVVDHLLSELENGETPFKVCIHIRDWVPGEFIAEQVVNSVKDSKRTLVVLSNNFVDSVWGKLEFRTAHTEAISEGRARVIVVLYGDLDESKLDGELNNYLKTNTYVKWGDRYFWNKLKYALPHSKNNFYERNKKQAKVMLKIDEKFDLIKNPPSPTNTSTPPITLDPSLLESKELKIDLTGKIDGEHPLLFRQP